ncbi:unnamed protein product, partial [Ectocarpus sp. 8 AP-2014]
PPVAPNPFALLSAALPPPRSRVARAPAPLLLSHRLVDFPAKPGLRASRREHGSGTCRFVSRPIARPCGPPKGTMPRLTFSRRRSPLSLSLRKSRALFGGFNKRRRGARESRRPDLPNHTSLRAGRASGSEPVASAQAPPPVFSPAARLPCALPEAGVLPPRSALAGCLSSVPLQTTPKECLSLGD